MKCDTLCSFQFKGECFGWAAREGGCKKRSRKCERCEGCGIEDTGTFTGSRRCPTCNGTGRVDIKE